MRPFPAGEALLQEGVTDSDNTLTRHSPAKIRMPALST